MTLQIISLINPDKDDIIFPWKRIYASSASLAIFVSAVLTYKFPGSGNLAYVVQGVLSIPYICIIVASTNREIGSV